LLLTGGWRGTTGSRLAFFFRLTFGTAWVSHASRHSRGLGKPLFQFGFISCAGPTRIPASQHAERHQSSHQQTETLHCPAGQKALMAVPVRELIGIVVPISCLHGTFLAWPSVAA